MMRLIIFLCCGALLAMAGCNVINPAEPVPSYLKIDSIFLATNYTKEGSSSSKIKDAWVYIDNNPVGVYEIGTAFPVLYDGTHKLSIKPGVLQNGINATHIAYPFFQFVTTEVELKSGETTVVPVDTTTYYPENEFPFLDDFEGLMHFVRGDNSDTVMVFETDLQKVFEGTKCGAVFLDSGQYQFEVKSQQLSLPKASSSNIYLEMNYRNTIPFKVMLQAEDAAGTTIKFSIITLNPSNDWNKIYIEVAPTAAATPSAKYYRLLFGTSRTDVSVKGEIYFDNIKIVNN